MSYRETLFAGYAATHLDHLPGDDAARAAWFREHVARNYRRWLPPNAERPAILEIGASRGFMLAALRELGYANLTGIDLSPADVDWARMHMGLDDVFCVDARDFLEGHPASFDVLITKAVLEHVAKPDVIPLLEAMRSALRPRGRVVIEVPNMDWLFATHERYMDFTHEVGFTRESLGQVLRTVFARADVVPVANTLPSRWWARALRAALLPVVRGGIHLGMAVLGGDAQRTWWEARSLIGVGWHD